MTLALRSGCNLRGLASPDLESGRSDGQNHAHVAVRHFGYLAPVALLQNLVKVPGGVVLGLRRRHGPECSDTGCLGLQLTMPHAALAEHTGSCSVPAYE